MARDVCRVWAPQYFCRTMMFEQFCERAVMRADTVASALASGREDRWESDPWPTFDAYAHAWRPRTPSLLHDPTRLQRVARSPYDPLDPAPRRRVFSMPHDADASVADPPALEFVFGMGGPPAPASMPAVAPNEPAELAAATLDALDVRARACPRRFLAAR